MNAQPRPRPHTNSSPLSRPSRSCRGGCVAALVAVALARRSRLSAGDARRRSARAPRRVKRCPTSAKSRRPPSRRRRSARSAKWSCGRSAPRAAYLEDPEVNDYLNELGHRLVAADSRRAGRNSSSSPMADPTVNAFALPGGYIGVNTGLILLTQTESELAAVLAHEITHVTQRHMARATAKEKNQLLYMLAALALAIAASRTSSSSSGRPPPRRSPRRRRSRSSRRSTSPARTNTKPIASDSSVSKPPASTSTRWRR